MSVEFSRPERLDAIGEGERIVAIAADETECAALARRFDLIAVDRLTAQLSVRRDATGIVVKGRVSGEVVQPCAITGERLASTIDEPVSLLFVEPAASGEEVELSVDALDTIEIEGSAIDLGEAAAETMALAIDPFPRGPNAAAALRAAGVLTEDEAKPMSAFAALKDRMTRKET